MKFPNPFEAFYKKNTIEGLEETEEEENTTTQEDKSSYDGLAMGMFIVSIALLFTLTSIIFWISIKEVNQMSRIIKMYSTTTGLLLVIILIFYRVINPENFAISGRFFGTYFMILIPVLLFLFPLLYFTSIYFVEIFGNTIGYNIITLFNNKFNEHFDSRIFPNSSIDLSPLSNIFSIHDFDETFKEFMIKILEPNNDIDFKLRNSASLSLSKSSDKMEPHVSGGGVTENTNYEPKEPPTSSAKIEGILDTIMGPNFNLENAGDDEKALHSIYKDIKDITKQKHAVGEAIWIYLASLLIVSTTINALTLD